MAVPRSLLEKRLLEFLAEDIGLGDVTTQIVQAGREAEAFIIVKEDGVVAGLEEAKILLESLKVRVKLLTEDGKEVRAGEKVMQASGGASAILLAERTVLNLLTRMSGVATETRRLVSRVRGAGLNVRIAATRKTTPGFRYFDKRAVMLGGGDTHRLHLDDMVLVKDNHVAAVGSLEEAVRLAKEKASFSKKVEVEVSSLDEALRAARLGVDIIMLDNMKPKDVRMVMEELERTGLRSRVQVELSGGITPENILEYASTKPDIVSLGYVTESPKALDMSLKLRVRPPGKR